MNPNVTCPHPWTQNTPHTLVTVFPHLTGPDGRPTTVAAVGDLMPGRFDGTIAELEQELPRWDYMVSEAECDLGAVAVFPAGATDVEDCQIPINGSDLLRDLAVNGQYGRYGHVMDLMGGEGVEI